MLLAYILCALACAAGVMFVKRAGADKLFAGAFYVVQAAFAVWLLCGNTGTSQLGFFTMDTTGTLFFTLTALTSPIVWYHGLSYLDRETDRQKRIYNTLLILLCVSIALVYFSDNAAVTWIFLEATTLCTAGLIYHRRDARSLEATWKYIFVCSVGIAIAYLGVLLLGGIASGSDMSYANLEASVSSGNALFMKLAFLFIMVGYSCKMELFPLYTIGVDANYAAPAPASALISTSLVNAGFVAIYRIYKVMEHSGIYDWVRGVLIVAGLISVLIGAVFLRQTRNYKRMMAYSTVENMGIAAIGLGLGGMAVFAAILHLVGHTFLKSSMFLQMASIGKRYGTYNVSRIGGYMQANPAGSALLLVSMVLLLGFPPSPLFVSEIMIFKQMIVSGGWWMLAIFILMICAVVYNMGRQIIKMCFKPARGEVQAGRINTGLFVTMLLLVVLAVVLGLWQPEWLVRWFNSMVLVL